MPLSDQDVKSNMAIWSCYNNLVSLYLTHQVSPPSRLVLPRGVVAVWYSQRCII